MTSIFAVALPTGAIHIDQEKATLTDAKNSLAEIEAVDFSALEEAIAYAESLVNTDYSIDDWNDILAAVERAKETLTSLSQEEVDTSARELIEFVDSKPTLDFSAVNLALEKAYGLDEKEYTVETWAAFMQAFDNAKTKCSCQIQSEIDEATVILEEAINDLAAPDYAEFEKAVEEAKAVENVGYTTESWTAFIKVVDGFEKILSSRSQTEINSARTSIVNAMAALTLPNYEALKDAIKMADELLEGDYSEEDWANIVEEVDAAHISLESKTQAEIDMATAALNAVISSTPRIYRDELVAIIAEANLKIETDFTVETWGIFIKVLSNANAKFTSRVQSDIDEAVSELIQAMNALASPDYSALNQSLEDARSKIQDLYTEESWIILSSSVEAAKKMLNSRSQVEIDEAKITLDAAIADLKDKNIELDNIVVAGGCSAALSASTAVLVAVLTLGLGIKKKKED